MHIDKQLGYYILKRKKRNKGKGKGGRKNEKWDEKEEIRGKKGK